MKDSDLHPLTLPTTIIPSMTVRDFRRFMPILVSTVTYVFQKKSIRALRSIFL